MPVCQTSCSSRTGLHRQTRPVLDPDEDVLGRNAKGGQKMFQGTVSRIATALILLTICVAALEGRAAGAAVTLAPDDFATWDSFTGEI